MTEAAVAEAPERGEARPGGGYEQPEARRGWGGFELWSWVFMRVSGLLLIFMALYHLVWWNLMVGVEHLDSGVVLERWSNPWFRAFNVGLVTFAMLHGLNGLRYSIEDYVHGPRARLVAKVVAYTIGVGAMLVGIAALLTFDPAALAELR